MEMHDLKIHRCETFQRTIRLKKNDQPLDLTGYTAKCQVRDCPDGTELICDMEVSIAATEGKISLKISSEITKNFQSGTYAWDLKVNDPDGNSTYYLGGKFIVLPSVTE